MTSLLPSAAGTGGVHRRRARLKRRRRPMPEVSALRLRRVVVELSGTRQSRRVWCCRLWWCSTVVKCRGRRSGRDVNRWGAAAPRREASDSASCFSQAARHEGDLPMLADVADILRLSVERSVTVGESLRARAHALRNELAQRGAQAGKCRQRAIVCPAGRTGLHVHAATDHPGHAAASSEVR
jgi:hypothetical protein